MKSAGTVRIIGGTLRGSRLRVSDAAGLRPTPDRIRETLFNWLAPVIEGARCIDLFAGTGALGLEAISRGAAACTFVERDHDLVTALEQNIARLGVAGARVRQRDALTFLDAPAEACDVVFVDPPFDAALWSRALALIENGWLQAGGLVYIESPEGADIDVPANWLPHRRLQAGAVCAALYRRPIVDPLS